MRRGLIGAFALLAACCFAALQNRGAAKDPPANPQAATNPAAEAWPPQIQRVLPPIAKPLSESDRKKAEAALDEIRRGLAELPKAATKESSDVEIFAKAIEYALRHNEFFDAKRDMARVETLRTTAAARIDALKKGAAPWREQRGVVVRGYRSLIDDSVQPYGLVIPEKLNLSKPVPLYIWLHGRGDTSCDLQFISNFLGTKAPGPLQVDDAIILHPFGRYCNGFKSAGEIDVLEAMEDVATRYRIDRDRIVLAGFSMGGAGAWHMGAHFTNLWCAVHAGAGFVDVRRYQNITDDKLPPWYVQKLWGLYDVPDYRRNYLNVPLIAYSGELDKQKAAADVMEQELAREGLKMTHLIGPGMGHKYHPEVLVEVQKRLAAFVEQGRNAYPAKVSLQTKTLRYSGLHWVGALTLLKHWDDARIDAEFDGDRSITVTTKNIGALRLAPPKRAFEFSPTTKLTVDGQAVAVPKSRQPIDLRHDEKGWSVSESFPFGKDLLIKRPGLQGPIDDAFSSPFTVVLSQPVGRTSLVDRWATFEADHALNRWRELMRGDARVAPADAADPSDLKFGNIVLWGTPQTNPAIVKILDKLPIKWNDKTVGMGDLEFDATKVVPVLIYPNPSNPSKYVVLNSGLTFREAHDKTNSQQNPKLPDWAFVDVTQPPTDELPGKVLAAGFFDENWKYVPQPKVDAK